MDKLVPANSTPHVIKNLYANSVRTPTIFGLSLAQRNSGFAI